MTRVVRAVCSIFVFSLTIGVAMAQMRNGTITGTVTDQSGAVVAGATVRVTDQQTNTVSVTKTNAAGIYTVPYLPQGEYKVTVEAPGFKTYTSSGIVVATNATVQANVELTVGGTRQMVEVKASAAQLQTQSSTVSGGVGSNVIDVIPNITNNPLYYATLAAGVVPTPGMYDTHDLGVGFSNRQEYSAIWINGGMVGNNDVQIDGVPVQEAAWHTSAVIPNSDALQEVRVQTNDLAADIGGGQGVIQMVTKSGTNSFHGDLNYVVRNEAFNSNGFANDLESIPKGKFRVNEGGGSIGGPVIIPKLFNGKDKMFFFFAFDRLTHTEPVNVLTSVPTLDERNGDFTNSMIANNSGTPTPVTIYNPWSATLVPGTTNVYQRQPFLDANGNPTENLNNAVSQPASPFPGTSAIDPFALLYLQAYPQPNHGSFNGTNSGTDAYNDNNYFFSGSAPVVRNNLNTRLDLRLGSKNSLYLSGGMQNGLISGVNEWGASATKLGFYNMSSNDISDFNPYASVGDVITLNPTTLLDLHVGMQRVATTTSYPAPTLFNSSEYSAYGMPTAVQQYIAVYGVAPSAGGFSNYKWGFLNNDTWDRKNEHQTNYDFAGSITKIKGKWTLKEGADYRVYLGNWRDLEFGTPALEPWDETPNYTAQYANQAGNPSGTPYNTQAQQYGYWPANAVIGTMGWRLDPGTTSKPALAAKYMALYTQNDWKVSNRLTLNLGLRYEVQPGPTERHNHIYGVDLSGINPYAQGFIPAAATNPLATYGAMAFPGQGTYSRNLWDTQWNNISPRLGAAYRLNDSTALRGGWGRIYAPSNTGFNANTLVYGGAAFSGGTEPNPYGLTPNGLPVGTFDQAPATMYYPAAGAQQEPDLYGDANGASNVDYFLRHGYKNALMDQWNLMIEHRFHGWVASAGYVGSRGTDLGWRLYPLNGTFNIPDTTLQGWRSQWIASSGAFDPAQQLVPNPLPALIGHATGPIGNTQITLMQSEEAYLGLLGQSVYASAGKSMYDALELRLSHPFGNGLATQFIYDWTHSTGLAGGANGTYAESQTGTFGNFSAYAPGGSYNFRDLQSGLLGSDIPQRFVGVVTYNPPFGKGTRFAFRSAALNAITGGWTLGTVVTLQSGMPWGPDCSSSQNGGCIPTGQPLVLPKSFRHWYNGSTPVTLPDGRTFTPAEFTYLYWNPDAFTAPVVQFPNGNYAVDQYWYGTTSTYMGGLRMPYVKNVNFTLQRSINLTERFKLKFIADASNLFNNNNFLPSALSDNSFGTVFTTLTPPNISSGAKIGGNADPSAALLSPTLMYPREVTLSMRLIF